MLSDQLVELRIDFHVVVPKLAYQSVGVSLPRCIGLKGLADGLLLLVEALTRRSHLGVPLASVEVHVKWSDRRHKCTPGTVLLVVQTLSQVNRRRIPE